MRRLYWILMICAVSAYSRAEALSHAHANHGMLLLGSQEIFASHIVNKVPHHWQVELRVRFSDEVREKYLEEKMNYPDERLILVLQHLDLAEIKSAESLTGFIVRVDESGKKTTVIPDVTLAKADFEVLYTVELPLSLAPNNPSIRPAQLFPRAY